MDIVRTPGGIIIAKQKLQLLERNIRRGKHTLIVGPTGSAKTRLAKEVAQYVAGKVEIFHFSALLDPEAALNGTKELADGDTVFTPSRFIKAITTPGCVVLLDEINRAPGQATNALMSLTDFQRSIGVDLDCGERRVVRLAEGVVFLATANVGVEYCGTETLDMALLNRFLIVRLGFPANEQSLLVEQGLPPEEAAWAVRVATEVRKANARGQLPLMSTRGLVDMAGIIQDGSTMEEAVESVVPVFDDPSIAALKAIVRATR
jgi:nitric oxide reductase NorQ protein